MIVQVYAPTLGSTEEEIEAFYNELDEILLKEREYYILIIGDWNAKVGRGRSPSENVGKYGFGVRNKNGDRLVEFGSKNNLKIANTFFEKNRQLKWTWQSPDSNTKNEIDHCLTNDMSIVKDVTTLSRLTFPSDHRMCRARIEISKRAKAKDGYKKTRKIEKIIPTYNLSTANKELQEYTGKIVKNEAQSMQESYDILEWGIRKIIDKFGVNRGKIKTDDKVTRETKELIEKRNILLRKDQRTREEKIELTLLKSQVKQAIRKDLKDYESTAIEEILEENGSSKKVKKFVFPEKSLITSIKSTKGEKISGRREIVKEATEFYRNLYSIINWDEEIIETRDSEREEEEIPPILEFETRNKLNKIKIGKISGPDKIGNRDLKNLAVTLIKPLTIIFNKILTQEVVPSQWKTAEIILLHKKGRRDEINNYRPISLTPNISKIFMSIIKDRMYNQLDMNQSREQGGFRKGYSTIDHIFTLNQLIEKAKEYNMQINLLFIDFHKAFDSVSHMYIWRALKNQGIPDKLIRIIKNIYEESKAYIKMDRTGEVFNIKRGVRQGDPLSPNMFNSVLEEIVRNLKWEEMGIKINGEFLSHLRFADDVVIISDSISNLEKMGEEFIEKSREAGLIMNKGKTIIMSNAKKEEIKLGGDRAIIEWCEETKYLGQILSFKNRREKELGARIKSGWKNYWALRSIYKSKISKATKTKIWEKCTLPALTYGAQTWALTKTNIKKLQASQRAMERSWLGIKKKDKIKSMDIRKTTEVKDIAYKVKKLKWKFAGHISRKKENTWAKIMEEWVPIWRKRPRGRPITRWRDEIVKEVGPMWKWLARNRRLWKVHGEASMFGGAYGDARMPNWPH